jgi:hypothetical protein
MECSVAGLTQSSRALGSSILASLSQAGRHEPLRMEVSPFPLTPTPGDAFSTNTPPRTGTLATICRETKRRVFSLVSGAL